MTTKGNSKSIIDITLVTKHEKLSVITNISIPKFLLTVSRYLCKLRKTNLGCCQILSRSAHRTPNFTNPEYFVCLLFEYFFQIKVLNQYQNTPKSANITHYIKKKKKHFATL